MGKDTKGKCKTGSKKVKGGKRVAETQDVTSNESTDNLRNALIAEMSFMISLFENYGSRRLLMFLYQG